MLKKLFKSKNVKREYNGFTDHISIDAVMGWVYESDNETPVDVEVYLAKEFLGKTTANLYRQNLVKNAVHTSGKCGFHFILNKKYDLSDLMDNLEVRVGKTVLKRSNLFAAKIKHDLSEDPLKKQNYFFIHIPKTAGTSFRNMLYEQFPKEATFPSRQDIKNNNGRYPLIKAIGEKAKEDRNKIHLIAGHYHYPVGDIFNSGCRRLVFLRKPLERAISNLLHLKKYQKDLSDKTYESIFESSKTHLANLQTRYLAGVHGREIITREDLKVAKTNLRKCYFIGITEDFTRSVALAEKVFGWEFSQIRSDNINHANKVSPISNELTEKLNSINQLDHELYQFGLQLFDEFCSDHTAYLKKNIFDDSKDQTLTNIDKANFLFLKDCSQSIKPTRFSIDKINGKTFKKNQRMVVSSPEISFSGWAVDDASKSVFKEVWLLFNGTKVFKTKSNIVRADVAKKLSNESFKNAGFEINLANTAMPKGNCSVGLIMIDSTGKNFYASTEIGLLDIKEPSLSEISETKSLAQSKGASNGNKKSELRKVDTSNFSFLENLQQLNQSEGFLIDKVYDIKTTKANQPIQVEASKFIVQGWAYDVKANTLFKDLYLLVNDSKVIRLDYNKARLDVAKKFNNPKIKKCGFHKEIEIKDIPLGQCTFEFVFLGADEKSFIIPNYKVIVDVSKPSIVKTKSYRTKKTTTKYKKLAKSKIEKFDQKNFSFLKGLEKAKTECRFSIDRLNDVKIDNSDPIIINPGVRKVELNGWAIDKANDDVFKSVYCIIDNNKHYKATYFIARNDVALKLENPNFSKCGFEISIDRKKLSKGKHSISLVLISNTGKTFYSPSKRIILDIL